MKALRASARSALTAGLLLGAAVTAPAAQANAAEPALDHCVYNVSTGEYSCYTTFRAAVAKATNGQVTDAPLGASAVKNASFMKKLEGPKAARTDAFAPADITFVISIEYDLKNYNDGDGASIIFDAHAQCVTDGARDYTVNDIRDVNPWWNDRISSFEGSNHCEVNHYEHQVRNGGDTTGAKARMASMGDMHNKTTGLTFG